MWPVEYSPRDGISLPKLDHQKTMPSVLNTLFLVHVSVTCFGEDQIPHYGNATWGRSGVSSQQTTVNWSLPKNQVSDLGSISSSLSWASWETLSLKHQLSHFWILDIQKLRRNNCVFFHVVKFWSNLLYSNR